MLVQAGVTWNRTVITLRDRSLIQRYGRRSRGLLILVFLVTACDRRKSESVPEHSAAAPVAIDATLSAVPPRDTAGSGAINWTAVGLQKRLHDVGIPAVAAGEVRQPFLGSLGTRFTIPGGELQAYVYADAVALSRDVDLLDSVRVAPPTMMIEWRMPPSLIISNNLALILLTRDPQLRKQITGAVRPNLYRHDESARPMETNTRKQ